MGSVYLPWQLEVPEQGEIELLSRKRRTLVDVQTRNLLSSVNSELLSLRCNESEVRGQPREIGRRNLASRDVSVYISSTI